MTVLMASAMSFAQTEAQLKTAVKAQLPKATAVKVTAATKANQPMRSVYNGNYYVVPSGALYLGSGKDGRGYQGTLVNVTALANGTFANMNSNPASAAWYFNGQDAAQMGFVDENNNFVWGGRPQAYIQGDQISYYAAPELRGGADTYTLPCNIQGGVAGIVSMNEPTGLTFACDGIGSTIYGYTDQSDTKYLFGSGIFTVPDSTGKDVPYTMYGAMTHLPQPMSPLYVEEVYLPAISRDGNAEPLKNGAALTMRIVGDSGDTIATLTGTAEKLTMMAGNYPMYTEPYGMTYMWTIAFSNEYDDPIWGRTVEPFIINEPFTVEITGFDNPDVNLGLHGFSVDDVTSQQLQVEQAYILVRHPETQENGTFYFQNMSLPLFFTAMNDNIVVADELRTYDQTTGEVAATYPNANVLYIDNNGIDSWNDNESGLDALFVSTAAQWEEGGYSLYVTQASEGFELIDEATGEGTCSWLKIDEPQVTTSDWEANGGANYIKLQADELTEGGRWAVVYVRGRGVTSDKPIYVLQGDVNLDDVIAAGIDNVQTGNTVKADPNAPVYNLNGQRVSKATKGIVIQNGKKFVNK